MSLKRHGSKKTVSLFSEVAKDQYGVPEFRDLMDYLRFSPSDGRIWLHDNRMMMMHVSSFSVLQRELLEAIGIDASRALLTRMGYASGAKDAEVATEVRRGKPNLEVFEAGPALHAIEGVVSVEPIELEVDVEAGKYYGELLWRDSAEADAYVSQFGLSTDPVCWNQIGYACGYTSMFMGKQILYKEVKCKAMGHSHCHIVGKPAEDWPDNEPVKHYINLSLQGQAAQNGVPSKRVTPASPTLISRELSSDFDQLVGASSGFIATCRMLEKVARTDATVLFLGETGVGKERFAQTLHRISNRNDQAFVAVNCAAIPETLVESELFGVEKGAFTDASVSRPGRFERAHKGTLFLDEVGTLTMPAQGKMLRVLQEGEVERVGDIKNRKVDVRLVAATNVDLKEAVSDGAFREDLWFRLNIFPIRIPPLRERRDDIPLLMSHFLRKYCDKHCVEIQGFTERAVDALLHYHYPGNIRELENMIERAVILAQGDKTIHLSHLFSSEDDYSSTISVVNQQGGLGGERHPDHSGEGGLSKLASLVLDQDVPLDVLENTILLQAVERAGGNLANAARTLGITRPQLAYRYKKAKSS